MESYIEKQTGNILWPHLNSKEVMVSAFLEIYADRLNTIIKDANEICFHKFNFLGMNEQEIGAKIDWQKDFKSGYAWDNRIFFKDVKYGSHFSGDADVIIPWELSRFQHLPTLGKAYWFTNEQKYVEEFIRQIIDWINDNPVNFGINWVSPMDVGIRAFNWVLSYRFFYESELITDSFLAQLLNNLDSHASYLMGSIRKKQNNNHRIAGFVGLLSLGLFLTELKSSGKWVNYAITGLIQCMKEQVYADGVNYEGAICYHRLVTEMFLDAFILCKYSNICLPEEFLSKLEKMLEFVADYTPSSGKAPQVGDNDDGRMHILSDYSRWDRNDHRYLLSTGAVVFKRPDFAQVSGRFYEESFWLLGEVGYKEFSLLINAKEDIAPLSKTYKNSGYYIMKNSGLYMIADCLSVDKNALTGHRHNSRLSFEMSAYGKSFIVDPGTYIYTPSPELRNKFRSTKYHNTASVDGAEQNDFMDGNLFWTSNHAQVIINRWESNMEYDILDAQHLGFRRLREPIVHQRIFLFNKSDSYWVIIDDFFGKGKHKYEIFFHFAPIKIDFHPEYRFLTSATCNDINVFVIPLKCNDLSVRHYPGWVSRSYGVKIEAPVLEISKVGTAPQQFITLIYPFKERSISSVNNIKEMAFSFLRKCQYSL